MNFYSIKHKVTNSLIPFVLSSSHLHLLTKPFYSGIGQILMFHRVFPQNKMSLNYGNYHDEITPESLENIIQYFRKYNYDFISLDKLHKILNNNERIKKPFVVFTFDDGTIDNFIYAYPILKKNNIPFCIYVTTSFPDKKGKLWWMALEKLISSNKKISIKLDRQYQFNCNSEKEKEQTFFTLLSIIMKCNKNEYYKTLDQIFSPYNIDLIEETNKITLDWEQLKELSKDPIVTIGSHTVNHLPLNNISFDEAYYEINESKRRLEIELGKQVNHFAYPYGSRGIVEKIHFDIAKKAGYLTATTTRYANIFDDHKNHLTALPRVQIVGPREGKNVNYLRLWQNGLFGCLLNNFQKIVSN